MLTDQQKNQIKATVPVLRAQGVTLTTYFYARMFRYNPELRNLFNQGNQQSQKQPTALAMAVLAYAEAIDNPHLLQEAFLTIGHKHVSLAIQPEQYLIVGKHLLAAMAEVLQLSPDSTLLEAWAAAYNQLVSLMTNTEHQLYTQTIQKPGGWVGWRPFIVRRKVNESAEIASFYLYPADGGQVGDFLPGQYVSLRLFLPQLNLFQPRQYSLSQAPNGEYYRISVKRESGSPDHPDGMISNRLHEYVQEGAMIELTAPAGRFTLQANRPGPVVFISGGIGQTPLLSMAEHLVTTDDQRTVIWVYGARNETVHAFREQVSGWSRQHPTFSCYYFYEQMPAGRQPQATLKRGRVEIHSLKQEVMVPNATYYLCGPEPFLRKQVADLIDLGVDPTAIQLEEFGPQLLSVVA